MQDTRLRKRGPKVIYGAYTVRIRRVSGVSPMRLAQMEPADLTEARSDYIASCLALSPSPPLGKACCTDCYEEGVTGLSGGCDFRYVPGRERHYTDH
jgi:hypothetical protein